VVWLERFCPDGLWFWVNEGGILGITLQILLELVRIKLACRNPSKIPAERLFELDRNLYLINITVEGVDPGAGKAGDSGDEGDDQDDQNKGAGNDSDDKYDSLNDLDQMETNNGKDKQDKPSTITSQAGAASKEDKGGQSTN
jgi:hypothetical protein